MASFCEHVDEPSVSIKKEGGSSLRSWITINFSKKNLHHVVNSVELYIHYITMSRYKLRINTHLISQSIRSNYPVSAGQPGNFTPEKRAAGTHWMEGWMGHRGSSYFTKLSLYQCRLDWLLYCRRDDEVVIKEIKNTGQGNVVISLNKYIIINTIVSQWMKRLRQDTMYVSSKNESLHHVLN